MVSETYENFDYSSKDDRNVYEYGEAAKQGVRKDLLSAQKEINEGKPVDTIAIEDPMLYHMYGRTLNKLEELRMRTLYRTTMTKGIWIHGPTGTGFMPILEILIASSTFLVIPPEFYYL